MNLHKLKQQAGIEDNPDQEGLDLFAELIVQECVDHAFHSGDDIAYLKKHFGVEE